MARIIAKLKKINADRVCMRVYLPLLKRRLNLSFFYISAFLVFFFCSVKLNVTIKFDVLSPISFCKISLQFIQCLDK